jgi:hypothetical protein
VHPLLWIFPHAATLSQLLPIIAVVPQWKRTSDARRWVAFWCLAFFLSDVIEFVYARIWGNNLWLRTGIAPIEDALILYALSFWQVRPVTRIAFRIAIPLVVATYLIIAVSAGEVDTWKTFAGPFRALVVVSATLYTLISNLARELEEAWSRDWLWVTFGVTLYHGIDVATDPIVAAIGESGRNTLLAIYCVKFTFDVIAFILIWRGMRCPLPNGSSGST